jgi:hypothetical protein
MIFVITRGDGAVIIGRDKTPVVETIPVTDDVKLPVVFAFRSVHAADVVLTGARARLAKAEQGADGWLQGISAGQAAAAIKAEAGGLSYDFDTIHPQIVIDPPKAVSSSGMFESNSSGCAKFVFWGIFYAFAALLASAIVTAVFNANAPDIAFDRGGLPLAIIPLWRRTIVRPAPRVPHSLPARPAR